MARRRCKRVAASLSEGDVEGHCAGDAGGSHRLGAGDLDAGLALVIRAER